MPKRISGCGPPFSLALCGRPLETWSVGDPKLPCGAAAPWFPLRGVLRRERYRV